MIICLIYDMSVLQEAMFNITLSLYSIIYYTIAFIILTNKKQGRFNDAIINFGRSNYKSYSIKKL